jgi:hypothetical protein
MGSDGQRRENHQYSCASRETPPQQHRAAKRSNFPNELTPELTPSGQRNFDALMDDGHAQANTCTVVTCSPHSAQKHI